MGLPMKKSLGILGIFFLTVVSISADCPRCKAIESARAEEQAEHPQKVGYYDDMYPVHQKAEVTPETTQKP